MVMNMGPQHPSTHGVLRLKIVTDGEIVSHIEPIIGYLHDVLKNIAKILAMNRLFRLPTDVIILQLCIWHMDILLLSKNY